MNLAMIGALGKMTEWETHCRGALGNGVTKEQIRTACHVVGIYLRRAPGAGMLPRRPQGAGGTGGVVGAAFDTPRIKSGATQDEG